VTFQRFCAVFGVAGGVMMLAGLLAFFAWRDGYGVVAFGAVVAMLLVWLGTSAYIQMSAPQSSSYEAQTPQKSQADDAQVITMPDVGLIAYWGEQSAYVFHSQPIPNTAHALQPYAQVHVQQATTYRVRFEILDDRDVLVFMHEVEVLLVQATNLIVPPARLPLDSLKPQGQWTLFVYVKDVLAQSHRFAWRSDQIAGVDGHIEADGEVDEAILPLLADNYAHPLSLENLLAGKRDEA
jgi:hypothetical protein